MYIQYNCIHTVCIEREKEAEREKDKERERQKQRERVNSERRWDLESGLYKLLIYQLSSGSQCPAIKECRAHACISSPHFTFTPPLVVHPLVIHSPIP